MAKQEKPAPRFHSEAQRSKCLRMVADKQITQAQFDAMERATPKHAPLPKRKGAADE